MKTYLEEYEYLIKGRHVIAGYWIQKEVDNLVRDLQDGRFVYDVEKAHKRIRFMQTMALQGKAPYFGKPLQLLPWQLAFWESVYGFTMADSGLPRFVEVLLEVARKNGKSTMQQMDFMTYLLGLVVLIFVARAMMIDKQNLFLKK